MIGAVVIVKVRKRIIFHSKLQKFSTEEDRDLFINEAIRAHLKAGYKKGDINSYLVSEEPLEGNEQIPRGRRYCPYCSQMIKLKKGEFGSKICPICGISEQDFYFKKYNRVK